MRSGGSVDVRVVVGAVLMTIVSVVSLLAVITAFLTWPSGQRIDETALRGARIGQGRVLEHALSLLHLVSGIGLVLATVGIALVACTRRRLDLAVAAVVVVGGANITTQVLKYRVVERPNVGIETYTVNSLPSGHTTVAVSLAVALVLVAPPALRGTCAVLGTVVATLMGVATLAAGWHRPSDAVAAVLVVGAWTGAACAVLLLRTRRPARSSSTGSVLLLVVGGAAALALAVLALVVTSGLDSIPTDRPHLFLAYAGGAAGIGGCVALLLAGVLAVAQPSVGPTRGTVSSSALESSTSAKLAGP